MSFLSPNDDLPMTYGVTYELGFTAIQTQRMCTICSQTVKRLSIHRRLLFAIYGTRYKRDGSSVSRSVNDELDHIRRNAFAVYRRSCLLFEQLACRKIYPELPIFLTVVNLTQHGIVFRLAFFSRQEFHSPFIPFLAWYSFLFKNYLYKL